MSGNHRSRLSGFIIDCKDADLSNAAAFWSAAFGMPRAETEGNYIRLDASARDLNVEVQRVGHDSRVHLDIETDDIDAEVLRLEGLGAKRIERFERWQVMEAPTGQRFCVVRAKIDLSTAAGAAVWE